MLINCPKCGKNITDTAKTCIHCGETLSNYIACPECHNLCKVGSNACLNCGYDFAAANKLAKAKAKQAAKDAEQRRISEEKERQSRVCNDCLHYDREAMSNCTMYRGLFHPSASDCKHYFYSARSHEQNSCYLTTACVEYYGKPDDCYELQTLRNFRDNVLRKTKEGQALCDEYYKIAPPIVARLHELNDSANYEYIYNQILICIKHIENKEYDQAVDVYSNMCKKMKEL